MNHVFPSVGRGFMRWAWISNFKEGSVASAAGAAVVGAVGVVMGLQAESRLSISAFYRERARR